MSKFQNFFKSIDESLFKQIDVLISQTWYQKFTDKMAQLEEIQQKIINQFITITIIFLPLVLVAVMAVSNHKLKNTLATYQEMMDAISEFNSKNVNLNSSGQGPFASTPIKNKADLENKITAQLNSKGIAKEKVSLASFSQIESGSNFTNHEALVRFNEMTLTELTEFIQFLAVQEKFRFFSTSFKKNTETSLLSGEFKLHILSKS